MQPVNEYAANTLHHLNSAIRRIERHVHKEGKKELQLAGDASAVDTITDFCAQVLDPDTISGEDTESEYDESRQGSPEVVISDDEADDGDDDDEDLEDFVVKVDSEFDSEEEDEDDDDEDEDEDDDEQDEGSDEQNEDDEDEVMANT